jgi:hypothetical protein
VAIAQIEQLMHQQLTQTLRENSQRPKASKVIVSLTSYGHRLATVHLTLLSLLNQTVVPDKVILWLSEEEFKGQKLPKILTDLQAYGLTIDYCNDIGSYKKLIPSLTRFPDQLIITFDDDVIYPCNHIERLLQAYNQHPEAIICHHARKMIMSDTNIQPYCQWPFVIEGCRSNRLLPIGLGGVLYPPHSLHALVNDSELFLKLAPKADDLWFKCMALKQGTPTIIVDEPLALSDYLLLPQSQTNALWHVNRYNNDTQLQNILNYFPDVYEKLISAV